jgi:hypothetical protein
MRHREAQLQAIRYAREQLRRLDPRWWLYQNPDGGFQVMEPDQITPDCDLYVTQPGTLLEVLREATEIAKLRLRSAEAVPHDSL